MADDDWRSLPARLADEVTAPDPIEFDPPIDAREVCDAWGLEQPVAISPDAHQHTWWIYEGGEELPDWYGKRIASRPLAAGRFELIPCLTGRPQGELPGVVSGASPAYDVRERGGQVRTIEVRPIRFYTRATSPDDHDAQKLLAAMRVTWPAWEGGGEGWSVDPNATFVLVYDGDEPAAGAGLTDRDGIAWASPICLARRDFRFGLALLDALEDAAREQGSNSIRLVSSAFLYSGDLPYGRYGYETGPPYDGDPDVDVWAEKNLRPASRP